MIDTFATRFARLADVPMDGALRLATSTLDGTWQFKRDVNLQRDTPELADEVAERYERGV